MEEESCLPETIILYTFSCLKHIQRFHPVPHENEPLAMYLLPPHHKFHSQSPFLRSPLQSFLHVCICVCMFDVRVCECVRVWMSWIAYPSMRAFLMHAIESASVAVVHMCSSGPPRCGFVCTTHSQSNQNIFSVSFENAATVYELTKLEVSC